MANLIKNIDVPTEYRKRTTLASSIFYSKLEVYDNRVVGHSDNGNTITWYYKDYKGIDVVKANINSQFGQIVFLTGINSNNRAIGLDFGSTQNIMSMKDTNRILFCSGMFSFSKTNDFVSSVASVINKAFDSYCENKENQSNNPNSVSIADEILKLKQLCDLGIITQAEFDAKKNQLLGL